MEQGVGYGLTNCDLGKVRDLDLPAARETDGSRMAASPHLFDSPLVDEDERFLHALD